MRERERERFLRREIGRVGKREKDNEGKSAASFCCQVAALVLDMFCNFYSVKNHKIVNNSATMKLEKK